MQAWFLIIPVLFYFVGGIIAAHRIRAAKFSNRPDVQFQEIYEKYFEDAKVDKQEAEKLWVEAANALRIEPGKLRPSDRFDDELSYYLAWFPFVDLNDDFYNAAVKNMKERNMEFSIATEIKTVGDYIIRLAATAQ